MQDIRLSVSRDTKCLLVDRLKKGKAEGQGRRVSGERLRADLFRGSGLGHRDQSLGLGFIQGIPLGVS
jgi:hypothetical protein